MKECPSFRNWPSLSFKDEWTSEFFSRHRALFEIARQSLSLTPRFRFRSFDDLSPNNRRDISCLWAAATSPRDEETSEHDKREMHTLFEDVRKFVSLSQYWILYYSIQRTNLKCCMYIIFHFLYHELIPLFRWMESRSTRWWSLLRNASNLSGEGNNLNTIMVFNDWTQSVWTAILLKALCAYISVLLLYVSNFVLFYILLLHHMTAINKFFLSCNIWALIYFGNSSLFRHSRL